MLALSLTRTARAVAAVAVAALGVATLSGAALPPPPKVATPPAKATVLFIGDSITARYNDIPGSPLRGWWSLVAQAAGMKAVTSAESGSGMLMHGAGVTGRMVGTCKGSTFPSRLADIAKAKPKVIVLEGGRNDFKICAKGKSTYATKQQTQAAVTTYMNSLAAQAKALKVSPSDVYVLTPWGTAYPTQREWVRPMVKKAAVAHGFTWVPTSYLADTYTVDHTHPNTAGNVELARRVLKYSDIATKKHR